MAVFTVHIPPSVAGEAPPAEKIMFLREGFSWSAAMLGPLWLLWNRAFLATLGWTGDFADPVTFLDIFRTGNGQNWTGWGNKDYDALLDQAAMTVDAKARFELLQKAEALLLEIAPVTPVVHRARTYLIDPAVKNWEPAPLGFHRFLRVELKP